MCSNFLRPRTIFPAKFWTTYIFLMFDFEVLPQTVEHLIQSLVNTKALITRSNVFESNKFDSVNLNKFVNTLEN